MSLLAARELYCERDDRILFRNLDFAIASGEVIQVLGSNGSGKTTLLRILCGLNADFEGEISWQNQPVVRNRPAFHAGIFFMGHAPAVNKRLSPMENLRWYCASRGFQDDSAIVAALAEFGLVGYEDVPCYMMSAGQQRRVSLARMKLTGAQLWILDEPFTALDKAGVAELEAFLDAFVDQGGAVLLTTHHHLQLQNAVKVINLDQRV